MDALLLALTKAIDPSILPWVALIGAILWGLFKVTNKFIEIIGSVFKDLVTSVKEMGSEIKGLRESMEKSVEITELRLTAHEDRIARLEKKD